jgi:PST family polysaccharide transporter
VKKYNQIIKNFSYLAVIQTLSLILPFITYPYLVYTLGMDTYGKIIYYQTIILLFGILINFGFNISAVKSIAEAVDDCNKVNDIYSSILLIKITLFLFVCLALYTGTVLIELDNTLLWACTFLLVNELFVPQWYFQAIEKLKILAITTFFIKIITVILTFLIISNTSDYLLLPLINGGGFIATAIILNLISYRYGIRLSVPNVQVVLENFKSSFYLFVTSAVITVKNKLDIVIIGAFLGKESVTIYDFAQKVSNLSMMPINIINNAVFARMAKTKDLELLKKVIIFSLIGTSVYTAINMAILPYVVNYILNGNQIALDIARIMLLSTIIFSVSLPLAQNVLIVFNYSNLHLIGMISTTIVYLVCISILYFTNELGSVYNLAAVTVLVYLYELIYRVILVKRKGLL